MQLCVELCLKFPVRLQKKNEELNSQDESWSCFVLIGFLIISKIYTNILKVFVSFRSEIIVKKQKQKKWFNNMITSLNHLKQSFVG